MPDKRVEDRAAFFLLGVAIGAVGRYGSGARNILPNWIDLLVVIVFSIGLHWVSAGGFPGWQAGLLPALKSLTLPAIALAMPQAAILARVPEGFRGLVLPYAAGGSTDPAVAESMLAQPEVQATAGGRQAGEREAGRIEARAETAARFRPAVAAWLQAPG